MNAILVNNILTELNEIYMFIKEQPKEQEVDKVDMEIILFNVRKNCSIRQDIKGDKVRIELRSVYWECYYNGEFIRVHRHKPAVKCVYFVKTKTLFK